MTFVTSSADALSTLAEQPYDVVVSDLRMPRGDGASLLALVRERCPAAVRIVLSGQVDMTMVARAAAVARRLIAKPCETRELAPGRIETKSRRCSPSLTSSNVPSTSSNETATVSPTRGRAIVRGVRRRCGG